MAAFEGFPLQVSLTCPSCHQPLHLQGLSETALCSSCQNPVELGPEVWLGWFGPSEFAEALGLANGEAQQVTSLGGTSAKYAYGHRLPRCQKCKTDTPLDQLAAAADAGGYDCGCGERIRVRRAPDLAKLMMPQALYLVNEGPLGDDADEATRGREPVLFQCMACGGALKIDGSQRTVTCQFCSGSNYLPDGLWLRLHPPRTVRTFFLVARMDAAARRAARALQEDDDSDEPDPPDEPEPEDHEDDAPPPQEAPIELLERLASSRDSDVRKSVAANEATPADKLLALAADDDWDVRRSVARNPAAPEEALVRLARDSDSDVLEALANHPYLPIPALAGLLRNDHYGVRRAAVQDVRAPEEALIALARDESDDDVLGALAARGDLSPAVLSALAANDHYRARRVAASHPNTPPSVLAGLAADHDSDVLTDLARRPDLPAALVLTLGASDHAKVAALAQAHPAWSAAARGRTLRRLAALAVFGVLVVCAGGAAGSVGLLGMVGRKLMKLL